MIPVFQYLRGVVEGLFDPEAFEKTRLKIESLLDESVVAANKTADKLDQNYEFQIVRKGKTLDLSRIDFEKLKQDFKEKKYKNIEIADLRSFIEKKLELMLSENSTRTDFALRLQEIINKYNSGGMTTENYYDDLVKFTEEMKAEDERYAREGLTRDELELFDILKKEKMSKDEEVRVKNAARHLLKRLIEEQPKVLVQDWFKDTQSQIRVRSAIDEVLDDELPDTYQKELFRQKSLKLFDLVFEYSSKGLKWAA